MVNVIKRVSKQHAILFSVVVTLMTLGIASLFSWDTTPIIGIDKLVGDIAITLFCVAIIYAIGIEKTAGFQREGFIKGLVYGVPFIIIGICAACVSNKGIVVGELQPLSLSGIGLFTINMLLVGMNEEISMRALILNNLISKYGENKKGIYKAIIISSIIFGGIHLVNIFFIAPVTLMVQVVNATSAGVLFATIYICSKNIWAGIVIHALVNWLALFMEQCLVGGQSVLSVEMTIIQAFGMMFFGAVPPLIIAILLLKKKYFVKARE